MSIKSHSEPLVWLRVTPADLVDRPICIILVALRLLNRLAHVSVVSDYRRVAQIEDFGHSIICRSADQVLVGEPGCVVDLRIVPQWKHR